VISADELQSIREIGNDVEVVLPSGHSFTIIADSITENAQAFDLDVAVDLTIRAVKNVDGVKIPGNSTVIAPNVTGEFGFNITFTITAAQLAEKGLNADNAGLFYVNHAGTVTEMDKVKINTDGSVEFTVNHASFYILTEETPISAGDSRFDTGDVNGDGEVSISDVLEILMYLAGLDSVINSSTLSLNAALVVSEDNPAINDVLEILMKLAGLPNALED
jgi:hypothetical protein